MKARANMIEIGVDVGGTHTDVVAIRAGHVVHGKAPTTPDRLQRGVLDALAGVAESLGLSLTELLRNCDRFVNGTTVVTNAVTEFRGEKVGILVTRGFRDTFRMARGPRLNVFDDHLQGNPPTLATWDCTVEITERIDHAGHVVMPLAEKEVVDAGALLVAKGVRAIALTFLWSFVNPLHELRAKQLLQESYPDIFVAASGEVLPVARESERWNTTVFACFVRNSVASYVSALERVLTRDGLAAGRLRLFQCLGGTLSPAEAVASPLQLMDSGPVGGVIAARHLGSEADLGDLICADMGGTSFDVALIRDGEFGHSKRRPLGHPTLVTGLAGVDIVSIGAGGGSIASLDARGVPRVGPQSAGADPGPACFDLGGVLATTTDAMVALNLIDPSDYLGGRRRLDKGAAATALEGFGSQHGWDARTAALAIHDIAVARMVNALREVTVQVGYDPRSFTILAYGGMTPLFAAAIAAQAGVPQVVVPPHSAAFSAWGVVLANPVRRLVRTVSWNLDEVDQVDRFNRTAIAMVARAKDESLAAGMPPELMHVTCTGAFRFLGQAWEIDLPLDLPVARADITPLRERFVKRYEETYGVGTAWKDAPVVLVDLEVTTTVHEYSRRFPRWESGSKRPPVARTRNLVDPATRAEIAVPVYTDASVGIGAELTGPAILDGMDTTTYVPAGWRAVREYTGLLRMMPRTGG